MNFLTIDVRLYFEKTSGITRFKAGFTLTRGEGRSFRSIDRDAPAKKGLLSYSYTDIFAI